VLQQRQWRDACDDENCRALIGLGRRVAHRAQGVSHVGTSVQESILTAKGRKARLFLGALQKLR
jgi:hypothetical protein